MYCCKQQRPLLRQMQEARRKFDDRQTGLKSEVARQFAILRGGMITNDREKRAACEWLLMNGWDWKRIEHKLGARWSESDLKYLRTITPAIE